LRFAIALVALSGLHGQALDPEKLLESVRAKLQPVTSRLGNYACIETIDRSYFQPEPEAGSCTPVAGGAGLNLVSTDRLRLEVAVSQGLEIHSWPGATRFDARSLDQIISGGPIGAGAFATYLTDVFDNPGVVFHYAGEKTVGAAAALEFSFHVPLEASHYHVKAGSTWQPTAYDGSFSVDAVSLELQRLTIRTEELPPATSMCQADTTLEYHRVHIGDGDVLLPRQGQLQTLMRNGQQASNRIAFSDCREYQAESQLRFDTGEDEAASAKLPVRSPVALSIGLPVTLALAAPIDTDTAAAGDLIAAKVVKPVRRPGSSTAVIPAGATVRGRITRVEHHLLPTPYFLISVSFNRLELTGISSPFAARLDRDDELAKQLGANLARRGRGLESWDVGNFVFATGKKRYVLPSGYESPWFTLATPVR
jgi:hypothetical protein